MVEDVDFTLRFPFKVAPGQRIIGLEEACEQPVGPYVWQLEFKEPLYVLTVSGLPNEEACHEYKHMLWAALMWVQLQRGIAFKAEHAFEKIRFSADPEQVARNLERSLGLPYRGPVHGLANSNFPVAYPSSKQLRFCTVGDATLTVGTPAKQVLDVALEGHLIRRGMPVSLDEKYQTALDLYAAYSYEQTSNAKFLTLMLALECLLTPSPRHPVAREVLDGWRPELEARRNAYLPGSDEYVALDSILRELIFKRTDSLRRQVRTLVKESLAAVNDPRADALSSRAVEIYDARSTLVHEGALPSRELGQITQDAKEITESVLRAKYRRR